MTKRPRASEQDPDFTKAYLHFVHQVFRKNRNMLELWPDHNNQFICVYLNKKKARLLKAFEGYPIEYFIKPKIIKIIN